MNKYNLIESFFTDADDYIKFLITEEIRIIANQEGTCIAKLEKNNGFYSYTLTWTKDGKFIGDDIVVFKGSKNNVETFNNGCKTLSERLEIYIDKNNPSQVPNDYPAFKELTLTH